MVPACNGDVFTAAMVGNGQIITTAALAGPYAPHPHLCRKSRSAQAIADVHKITSPAQKAGPLPGNNQDAGTAILQMIERRDQFLDHFRAVTQIVTLERF